MHMTKIPGNEDKVAVLMSSGIDSTALIAHIAKTSKKVYPVYIQFGLRWEETELYWLKKFLRSLRYGNIESLTVLSVPLKDTYATHWSVTGVKVPDAHAKPTEIFLPGRNMMLLSKAAVFCAMSGIELLAIATSRNYPFEDGQPHFFRLCENVFSKSCAAPITIYAPYLDKSKDELMQEAKELGFDFSFSCIFPKGHQHCGDCYKCAERKAAFARLGLLDKTSYYKKLIKHPVFSEISSNS